MSTAADNTLDLETAREFMVERQVRTWEVLDPAVLDAMRSLPRDAFVPERFRSLAYADTQIPIARFDDHEAVMMQPKVEGRLLQALDIDSNDSILEIGTGTGWLTALLAHLGGSVHSIDIHEECTALAAKTLQQLDIANVKLETRDGSILEGPDAQYDCIAVTGSMPVVHDSFRRQLKIGGRLFVIKGTAPIMEAQLHTRTADEAWSVDSLFDTAIPALVNAWNPRRFDF